VRHYLDQHGTPPKQAGNDNPSGQQASRRGEAQRRFNRFVRTLALVLVVDGLMLLPVLFVVDSRPDLLWQELGPYLAATLLVLALAGYWMRRQGILDMSAPWRAGLVKLGGVIALLTIGLVAGVILATPVFWILVLGYLWALGFAVYATLKWQALYLPVHCSQCGIVTNMEVSAWLTALADGPSRRIVCASCGREAWGTLVSENKRKHG